MPKTGRTVPVPETGGTIKKVRVPETGRTVPVPETGGTIKKVPVPETGGTCLECAPQNSSHQ